MCGLLLVLTLGELCRRRPVMSILIIGTISYWYQVVSSSHAVLTNTGEHSFAPMKSTSQAPKTEYRAIFSCRAVEKTEVLTRQVEYNEQTGGQGPPTPVNSEKVKPDK